MRERFSVPQYVAGRVRIYRVGRRVDGSPSTHDESDWCDNTVLYDIGYILAQALRNSPAGKQNYIGGMYIEFDNSGAAVTAPTYGREDATPYYAGLNTADPNQDYLRVPLIGTAGSNSDIAKYSGENVGSFLSQTSGAVGVHGLTFSDSVNSRVYGVSLVAFREGIANASGDVIACRYYFASANQKVKQPGDQIGITWDLTIG